MTHSKILLDPSMYADPLSFRPKRGLADENREYERISKLFVPFRKVNWGCYGLHLVWAELYIGVAYVLGWRVKWELCGVVRERDVYNVRGCFAGNTRRRSKGVRARVIGKGGE